jgi:hypothetical protein
MCKLSLSATLSLGEVRGFEDLTHQGVGSPIYLITVRKHASASVQCHRSELQDDKSTKQQQGIIPQVNTHASGYY